MTIRSFGSTEEALAAMAEDEEYANGLVLPTQRTMELGTCWAWPSEQRVWIFGETPASAEELAAWSDLPLEAVGWAHTEAMAQRGYLLSRAFSVACPEGEMGDVHRSQAWPITRPQFESARDRLWKPEHCTGWLRPMIEAVAREAAAHEYERSVRGD